MKCRSSITICVIESFLYYIYLPLYLDDSSIVKPLLTLLFELTYLEDNSSINSNIMMIHLAQDIHSQLADINQVQRNGYLFWVYDGDIVDLFHLGLMGGRGGGVVCGGIINAVLALNIK